ncbi:protein CREG1 isoform X1 [Helicoverpa zea]|uniref:protein CREG1 isoform X1 n=2 Tax=Helicoverpa zea TaxID=7113 RepID=UPI001F5863F4|nr:protein CREG1 isoform X1 [Helicoverpa zea]
MCKLIQFRSCVYRKRTCLYLRIVFKMKWQVILFACLCFLNAFECKHYRGKHWRENANEVTMSPRYREGPPDHTKLIAMARYVLHNAGWASLATISVLPAIEGFPFSNVKSIVDGSLANSTGIPYFYMSPLDFSAKDLSKNSRATVLVSLEETRYCENQKIDPEDPRCTRLMLSGKMKKIHENTAEYVFAKGALFERHPSMADFPPDHNWFVAKLKIAQIAMVDWFGGAKYIPVRDYLAYNYTGREMMEYHSERLRKAVAEELGYLPSTVNFKLEKKVVGY